MGAVQAVTTVVVIIVAVLSLGLVLRHREGRARRVASRRENSLGWLAPLLERQGTALGSKGTLLLFTSPWCGSCPSARRELKKVSDRITGTTVVEIDASACLDVTRQEGILTTPTVLVLDGHGDRIGRISGVPRAGEVDRLLEERVPS